MGYNSVETLEVYLHSFSRCCLPKSQNQAKFRRNLTLQQLKVIQGHRSWCQWKAHATSYSSLIVTLVVSATVFETVSRLKIEQKAKLSLG